MNRQKLTAEIKLNAFIPANLCSDSTIPCRRRKSNSSCKLKLCGYNITTSQLPDIEKKMLADIYNSKRRN